MPPQLTRRLSAQDASFLYFERDNVPLHIGSVGVFQGQIPFDCFVERLDSRLHLIPRYRQRVIFPPFNLSHPTWEWDPDFDIRKHVRKVTLPPPADDQALIRLTGDFFAPPLSRDKPLWEIILVEDLEGDRSAFVAKVHHCLVDGVSGIELLMITVDVTPDPPPTPPPPEPHAPGPIPDAGTLLAGAIQDRFSELIQTFGEWQLALVDPLERLRRFANILRALQAGAPFLREPAPLLPFNVPLRQQRHVAWTKMPFAEVRGIRTALGGTVNDVVLAILCGALRRHFIQQGLSCDNLAPRVMVPVNVRQEDEQGALGNRVSAMFLALPMGIKDPVERLHAIREQVESLKRAGQAAGVQRLLDDLTQAIPVPLQAMGAGLPPIPNTLINLVCTNVPGPMIPLYSVGHRMLAHYPLVPLGPNLGLGVGVTSYDQWLFFGLMVDPSAMPDVDRLRVFLDESFQELRLAAGVAPSDLPTIMGRPAAEAAAPASRGGTSKSS